MTREAADAKLRLQRILDRSNDLIAAAASGRGTVTGIPTIGARSRVVTYRLRIKGALVEPAWEFDLADILLNVRSLLDNLVWQLAHADPNVQYTAAEERLITFPISETNEKWDQTVRTKPHLKRMAPEILARIRALQPFEAQRQPDEVVSFIDALHRLDKHRSRLRLEARMDPQFPMLFRVVPEGKEHGARDVDWLVSLDEELRSGLAVVRVTSQNGIRHAPKEPVPVAHFVVADGESYDLQDFLWDLQALAMRAFEVLQGMDLIGYEALRKVAEFRRERLAAFNRSMMYGTDEWERRGFADDTIDRLLAPE
ncbi:hypothetical protein [Curtobacterium sp. SORGH_AS_0776]|uniref:hypothetical protein n=1 Tax=Curtobacterium sp. SORGH_AS_0776 TaxID=3041798 RepID=UPI00286387C3|nr:hypothetical protein [Curtobacterium sp. SORGH_AS_0776]MDR6171559.1 hypothetical protein [Curtobacterium sp. SORGH_AS_0776]